MDSPNVNWGVLGLIGEERSKQEYPDMMNIGSHGLHNVHGAFKSGMEASEWNLMKVLKGAWQLFRDSPAWRYTCIPICESQDFPLRYVCMIE